jgi:hypothetical protein
MDPVAAPAVVLVAYLHREAHPRRERHQLAFYLLLVGPLVGPYAEPE